MGIMPKLTNYHLGVENYANRSSAGGGSECILEKQTEVADLAPTRDMKDDRSPQALPSS